MRFHFIHTWEDVGIPYFKQVWINNGCGGGVARLEYFQVKSCIKCGKCKVVRVTE